MNYIAFWFFLVSTFMCRCQAIDSILRYEGISMSEIINNRVDKKLISEISIISCHDFYWDSVYFNDFKNLNNLSVINSPIEEVPKWFEKLNIRSITFNANKIKEFPDVLVKMRYLEEINLSQNEISNIPVFEQNNTIRKIQINSNKLVSLNLEALSRLENIKIFSANNNRITHVEPTEVQIPSLSYLHLNFNQISELPSSFHFSVPNCQYLGLSNNRIEKLIIKEDCFRNLETLHLEFNRMTSLQIQNGFRKLKTLYLSGKIDTVNIYNGICLTEFSWEDADYYIFRVNFSCLNNLLLLNLKRDLNIEGGYVLGDIIITFTYGQSKKRVLKTIRSIPYNPKLKVNIGGVNSKFQDNVFKILRRKGIV